MMQESEYTLCYYKLLYVDLSGNVMMRNASSFPTSSFSLGLKSLVSGLSLTRMSECATKKREFGGTKFCFPVN